MREIVKNVVVIDGDDASPEAMVPSVALIERLGLPLRFTRPPVGDAARAAHGSAFPDAARAAIDAADATFFGATSGSSTQALFYLRWGKQTYANVRPCRWLPGYRSPLADPAGIDFVIVRENLEDLYLGIEGDIDALHALELFAPHARAPLRALAPGKFALKVITERGTERVLRFAFRLAQRRRQRLTVTCKYNMLRISDGYFRERALAMAADYPDVELETFIVDDFLCRMIARPQHFDVVVMPNLYGDIMSDGAAGLLGGLGLAASGCYGDDYAYFESAHGSAPDIQGRNVINPTATLLSGAMMLDYLGFADAGRALERAIAAVYAEGTVLTPDQGGRASTTAFCAAVEAHLARVRPQ
jgi:isocitrate/isopropylmalate dehydrogenase